MPSLSKYESCRLFQSNINKTYIRMRTPHQVIAELVDNARAAGATRVDVSGVRSKPDSFFIPTIAVRDNGRSMTATELDEGLHYGRRKYYTNDAENPDIGRHGCGLKIAVGGFCRAIVVFACTATMEVTVGAFYPDDTQDGVIMRITESVDVLRPLVSFTKLVEQMRQSRIQVPDDMLEDAFRSMNADVRSGGAPNRTIVFLVGVNTNLCRVTEEHGVVGELSESRVRIPSVPGSGALNLAEYLGGIFPRQCHLKDVFGPPKDIEISIEGKPIPRLSLASDFIRGYAADHASHSDRRVRAGDRVDAGKEFTLPGHILVVVAGRLVENVPAVPLGEASPFLKQGGVIVFEIRDPRYLPLADTKDALYDNGSHNVRAMVSTIYNGDQRARVFGRTKRIAEAPTAEAVGPVRSHRAKGNPLAPETDATGFFNFVPRGDGGIEVRHYSSKQNSEEERAAILERHRTKATPVIRISSERRRLFVEHLAAHAIESIQDEDRKVTREEMSARIRDRYGQRGYEAWAKPSFSAGVEAFRTYYLPAGEPWKKPESSDAIAPLARAIAASIEAEAATARPLKRFCAKL